MSRAVPGASIEENRQVDETELLDATARRTVTVAKRKVMIILIIAEIIKTNSEI